MTRHLGRILVSALVLITHIAGAAEHRTETLTVFAAASLTDSLQKVTDAYTKATGVRVKLAFASSSVLAKQIEAGAQADVFFSADQEWMDYLQQKALIQAGSRSELLGNRLVLVAPSDSTLNLKLTSTAGILKALGKKGRLATGDPDSVPAGKYAKAALISLNQWNDLERRLVRAENVRVALMYVARGEVPLGIVYETDAAVAPKVRVVDVFPESSHAAITYPIAVTKVARRDAQDYVAFLKSNPARQIFTAAGFSWIGAAR
jgi:molybdate transport system substrate-binding protein